MKNLTLTLILTLTSFSQAWASDDTEAVVSRLVTAINQTLQQKNADLAARNETQFCQELTPRQVTLIRSHILMKSSQPGQPLVFRDLQYVAVDDFAQAVAVQLMCYPLACETQRRASLAGVICNGWAYNKDLKLLLDSISVMAGRPVSDRASIGAVLQSLQP